jgi:poly-gamma-glutamate synthesis protein (capsule biosynthesis protein)
MIRLFLTASIIISFLSSGLYTSPEDNFFGKPDSVISVNLVFVGDIMCHTPQIEYARIEKDSFDFKPVFREVKKYLDSADLTFGNFETVLGGKEKGYSGYPLFNSPDKLLEALKDSGFDIFFTSNNHSLDQGVEGAARTIQLINHSGLKNVGSSIHPLKDSLLVVNIKGIEIGILSYTYGLNGNYLPKEKTFLVNQIDTSLIKKDVSNLKSKNVDVVLVYFHFGEEYFKVPSMFQKQIVDKTFKYGADIIIGSHPHVLQSIEIIENNNGKMKKGFVAYSLGNFISNQRWRYSDSGVILNLEIKKNVFQNTLWLENFSIIPTWVFKGNTGQKNEFVILPSDTSLVKPYLSFFTQADIQSITESFNDTKSVLLKK